MVIRVPGPRSTQAGSYAELDDRMLVLDFQAGQVEAFVEIHHRYAALTRHVCGRFLQNHQDVDEALQETWIRVFQGLHRFNGRYALQPWVARIATNVSLDLLRARSRRPQLDDHPIDEHEREDAADGPEEEVEKLIQRDMVIAVLSELPDAHRRALVLRELEGRSHKEIASELEMSPAQAKALIHRAKGTFRREWLRAATERHGLAGIFLIPVVWLSRLGGVARRLVDRAGEVAHTGGTEVLNQAAQAASTPIVPVAASGVGEKIIAAGLTLVVASGVTVGAATIAGNRADRDRPEAVVAAPVAVPTSDPTPSEPARSDEAAEKAAKGERQEDPKGGRADEEVVGPVVDDPSATPSVEPSPSTEPSPTTTPSDPPASVTPAPAPAWSASFDSTVPVGTASLELVSSKLSGELGSEIVFSQTASGPLNGPGGTEGRMYLEYWGSATASGDGSIYMWLFIDTAAGHYRYDAIGSLVTVTSGEDGEVTYTFAAPYSVSAWPEELGDVTMPHDGTATFALRFWADGTLYGAAVSLDEAPA